VHSEQGVRFHHSNLREVAHQVGGFRGIFEAFFILILGEHCLAQFEVSLPRIRCERGAALQRANRVVELLREVQGSTLRYVGTSVAGIGGDCLLEIAQGFLQLPLVQFKDAAQGERFGKPRGLCKRPLEVFARLRQLVLAVGLFRSGVLVASFIRDIDLRDGDGAGWKLMRLSASCSLTETGVDLISICSRAS